MPTWEDFKRRHVLNPNTEPGVKDWNKEKWNDLLKDRLKNEYGKKDINSVVVVGTEQQILSAFKSPPKPEVYSGNLFWSRDTFLIYFLKREYNQKIKAYDYRVRKLENFYFVASLDDEDRPIHFGGQNHVRVRGSNLPKDFPTYPEII